MRGIPRLLTIGRDIEDERDTLSCIKRRVHRDVDTI